MCKLRLSLGKLKSGTEEKVEEFYFLNKIQNQVNAQVFKDIIGTQHLTQFCDHQDDGCLNFKLKG